MTKPDLNTSTDLTPETHRVAASVHHLDHKMMRVISSFPLYKARQVECGPPQEAVWIAEGLRQFEMVVVLADQQTHLLTGIFDGSGKFAVLALKLGGLAGAVCDNQRRV